MDSPVEWSYSKVEMLQPLTTDQMLYSRLQKQSSNRMVFNDLHPTCIRCQKLVTILTYLIHFQEK